MHKTKGCRLLFVSEEFLAVFNEADENNYARAHQAYKEHDLEQTHAENCEGHGNNFIRYLWLPKFVT